MNDLVISVRREGAPGNQWWVAEASSAGHVVEVEGNTVSGVIRHARRRLRKHLATCPCPVQIDGSADGAR